MSAQCLGSWHEGGECTCVSTMAGFVASTERLASSASTAPRPSSTCSQGAQESLAVGIKAHRSGPTRRTCNASRRGTSVFETFVVVVRLSLHGPLWTPGTARDRQRGPAAGMPT